MEDAEDFTQVNISQAFQDAGVAVSLLPPNHSYDLARNSQDFGCQSQERGKVPACPLSHMLEALSVQYPYMVVGT